MRYAGLQVLTLERMKRDFLNRRPNRKIMPSLVASYGNDMAADRWATSPQGLCYDLDGRLCDGQHRLAAAIKVGKPVAFHVYVDLTEEEVAVLDGGRKRTTADTLTMAGRPVTTRLISICVSFLRSARNWSSVQPSRREVVWFLENFSDLVAFGNGVAPTSGGAVTRSPAAISAAFMRALVCNPKDKSDLASFGRAITSNPDPKWEPRYLTAVALQRNLAARPDRLQQRVYYKTESALRGFLEGRYLKKIFEIEEEAFPLPEDMRLKFMPLFNDSDRVRVRMAENGRVEALQNYTDIM